MVVDKRLNKQKLIKMNNRETKSNVGNVRSKVLENYSKYTLFSNGTIQNNKTKRFLNPYTVNEYKYVRLMDDCNIPQTFLLSRLIAENFIMRIPQGYTVNHINEDKGDNRVENLEIITHRANCNLGTRNKRISQSSKGVTKVRHSFIVKFGDEVEIYNTLTSLCQAHPSQNKVTWHHRIYKSVHPQETYTSVEDGKILAITCIDEAYMRRLGKLPDMPTLITCDSDGVIWAVDEYGDTWLYENENEKGEQE